MAPAGRKVEPVDGEAVRAAVFQELDDGLLGVGLRCKRQTRRQVAELRKRREGRGRREGGCRARRGDKARILSQNRRKGPVAKNYIVVERSAIGSVHAERPPQRVALRA